MGRKKRPKTYVISMRINTEEKQALDELMASQQIGRVSDLMRQAIEIVKQTPTCDMVWHTRQSAH